MASDRKPPKKNDRRQQLRAAARHGHHRAPVVSTERAVTGTSELRLLAASALALVLGAMAVHAVGALAYGQLSLFVVDGFAEIRGRAVICAAAAELVLVLTVALHCAAGYRGAGARWLQGPAAWRGAGYLLAVLLAVAVFVLTLMDRPRFTLDYPVVWPGLAPQSEWLLTPLPWTWHWLLPLASDQMRPWLLLCALATGAVGGWCFFGAHQKPRAGLALLGSAAVSLGFWSLGGAAYHYVAGRGLAKVPDAALAALFQARPGLYNADTLHWLLGGCALTLAGVLFIAAAASAVAGTPQGFSSTGLSRSGRRASRRS